jgi:hypothetical protein
VAGRHRFGGLSAQAFESRRHPFGALGGRPGRIQRIGPERADQLLDGVDFL